MLDIKKSEPTSRFKIDNRKVSAVNSKHWSNPGASLYDKLLGSYIQTDEEALKEAYLIAPVSKIKNDPHHGRTPYSRSGCKYPHHTIKGDTLVVDIKGVQAAYARAKQTGDYDKNPNIRKHLQKHYSELELEKSEPNNEAVKLNDDLGKKFQINDKEILNIHNLFETYITELQINAGNQSNQKETNQAQQNPPTEQSTAADNQTAKPTESLDQPVNPEPVEDHNNNPVEGFDNRQEKDGNARKALYEEFVNKLKEIVPNTTFGTIFDKDAFKTEFKIIPYELRYFYRLANPIMVEIDTFKFIPYGKELLDAQSKYGLGKKLFVFATDSDRPVFFNQLDKTVWNNEIKISDSFDAFIEVFKDNGSLPEIEDQIPEENVDNSEIEENPDQSTPEENATQLEITDNANVKQEAAFGKFPTNKKKKKIKEPKLFTEDEFYEIWYTTLNDMFD